MGVLGVVEVSAALLPCDRCRSSRLVPNSDLHTGYVRVDVRPPHHDGVELSCAVDVTEIEIKRVEQGVFEASAIALVPCPVCEDIHAVRCLLQNSSSVLRQLATCDGCGSNLDPLEQNTRFNQNSDGGGVLTLRARLRCQQCASGAAPISPARADGEGVYDVFLSYSSAERRVVEGIATGLREAGLNPFWDAWHVRPGDAVQEILEDGLRASVATIVFIGPSGIGTWQNEELRAALQARVTDGQYRVIPVILPGVTSIGTIPAFLRRLAWIDLRNCSSEEGLQILISAVREAVSRAARNAAHGAD